MITLANEYNWLPEQVARLDRDYITELIARIRARNAVEDARARRARRERGGPGGSSVEADISEIE